VTLFRFSLQKALEWRATQLELEEARFRQAAEAVAELDRARAALREAGDAAEADLRARRTVPAGELEALGEFRMRVRRGDLEIAAR
jgi:hypothetical protein